MSMKHRRGNKEAKKPKQSKTKPVASSSVPASHTNPARAAFAAKRR